MVVPQDKGNGGDKRRQTSQDAGERRPKALFVITHC
jgi:hypothetical protein